MHLHPSPRSPATMTSSMTVTEAAGPGHIPIKLEDLAHSREERKHTHTLGSSWLKLQADPSFALTLALALSDPFLASCLLPDSISRFSALRLLPTAAVHWWDMSRSYPN